jgi:hypothetical protein
MTDDAPLHPRLASDPGGRLDADRPCLTCGYNLRGLLPSDLCPECANPVFNSLRGELLRFSSPDYIAQLHRGVVLIQISIVGYFLLFASACIVPFLALSLAGGGGRAFAVKWNSTWAGIGISTALSAVSIVGWWLFSARDPAIGERDEGATARVFLRACILVQAAATFCSLAMNPGGSAFGQRPPRPGAAGVLDILGALLALASLLALVVWWFAAMRYVRRLAPRIPSESIYRRAKLLTWLFPVLMILICVGWLVDLILYYNLFNLIRKELQRVRTAQAAVIPDAPPPAPSAGSA